MNTIICESLDYCASRLEAAVPKSAEDLHIAVQSLLAEIIAECEPIIFNGDGYSAEWHQEAARRGLLNLRTSVDALMELKTKKVHELFTHYEVLSERELESRLDIYLEQYCKTVRVEALETLEMAKTLILPAALRYQNELASTCANLKLSGLEFDTDVLEQVTDTAKCLLRSVRELAESLVPRGGHDLPTEAAHYCEEVLPAMSTVRGYADELEGWVADDLWPLPTYQEMLFIK
jgi:glutamine synthetase